MNTKAVSIGTTFNYDIPLKEQLPMIKRAGFTHISIGAGNLEHSNYLTIEGQKNVEKMVHDAGLSICSVHAPFLRKDADISSCDKKEAIRSLDIVKKCIDAAIFLQAGAIIIHPCPMKIEMPEARKAILVNQIRKLIDYMGKEPVKIAVENLPSPLVNSILSHSLEQINDAHYGFCYDSSHDNLMQNPLHILKVHGDRLITTHISDNHGRNDDHLLPFEGTFPWNDFCGLFRQTGFKGIFLLEVEMRESASKVPAEFLSEAYQRGIKLLKQVYLIEKSG